MLSMLGEKALELVKELQRSRCGSLPPFNVRLRLIVIMLCAICVCGICKRKCIRSGYSTVTYLNSYRPDGCRHLPAIRPSRRSNSR